MANTYAGFFVLMENASRFLDTCCVSHRVLYIVNLALEEILTNTIKYGYEDTGEHEIHVQLAVDTEAVVIRCVDDGREFDPLNLPEADLTTPIHERPVGGLGIHLVRKTVDAIEYRRNGGKNILTMRVALTPAQNRLI